MGTKADFYTKDGDVLTWHGSIEWEGSEEHIPDNIVQSSCREEFLINLNDLLDHRSDAVRPSDGWPWHWNSSKQTDYTYIMVEERGAVYISRYNSPCYTVYDYRSYKKRSKLNKKEGKTIEDFYSFVEKVSPFTPSFPPMRGARKTTHEDQQ